MNLTEVMKTSAVEVPKTIRTSELRNLTSIQPGRLAPIHAEMVLREDRISRGRMRIKVDMMETAQALMNAVNITARVHLVPFLAFERFEGSLDRLNKSYSGQPDKEGGDVIPFFETVTYDRDAAFWKTLGIHAVQSSEVNSAYLEAYNLTANHLYKSRSTKLTERLLDDTTLAKGFWKDGVFNYIVPDYEQAMLDGEVPMAFGQSVVPVDGIGALDTPMTTAPADLKETGGDLQTYAYAYRTGNDGQHLYIKSSSDGTPEVSVNLDGASLTLNLANIELAKRTSEFAKLRKSFATLGDDAIIDMLLEGIRVPDLALAKPMLLSRKSTVLGYSTRHATDSGNLDKSVTVGETYLDLNFVTPPINTGGILIVTLEAVPEQLWERQTDNVLNITSVDQLPQTTRDHLDPYKVEVVQNKAIDCLHSDPDGVFGYAPLNHAWKRNLPRIGGKYQRPTTATFVEDRQKFWAAETIDPALTEDFYLVDELPNSVFADTVSDPFEVTTLGMIEYVGRTQFGKGLQEDTGEYDKVQSQVDTSIPAQA